MTECLGSSYAVGDFPVSGGPNSVETCEQDTASPPLLRRDGSLRTFFHYPLQHSDARVHVKLPGWHLQLPASAAPAAAFDPVAQSLVEVASGPVRVRKRMQKKRPDPSDVGVCCVPWALPGAHAWVAKTGLGIAEC